MTDIAHVISLAPLAANTRLWFVDVWGVLHNGVRPFESAVDACRTFREKGGLVLLVSNSPRPREGVARQLEAIGVARATYDAIVTSGDVSRSLIAAYAGKPVFHLGPERDLPIYKGTGATPGEAADAVAVVCTGLFDDDRETPADYADCLAAFAARALPMVCANPDLQVERGGRLIYCAGALAEAYEKLGGQVFFCGKPYPPIYDESFAKAAALAGAPVAKMHTLAIGDGVRTDILGAARAGIASIFVASAVHVGSGESLAGAAARLFPDPAGRPLAVMSALAW